MLERFASSLVFLAFLCFPLGLGGTELPAGTKGIRATAQQWRMTEITLTSQKTYANPYVDVDVSATFTGPDGSVIERPAFWNGGNTWKIRFAPTSLGTWTFTTTATDATDAGLGGQTGSVEATAYSGTLPIYRHGFVKSQPGHNLVYNDGTPFWWMGYDMILIDVGKLDQSNKTNWNPMPAHPNSQILGSIDQVVTQKFNVINYHPTLFLWKLDSTPDRGTDRYQNYVLKMKASPPGRDSMLDIDHFTTFIDPVIAYMADRGLTINLTIGAGETNFFSVEILERFARYFVARYGAYPVVWNISQPDAPVDIRGRGDPPASSAPNLGKVLAYTASIDGYHHPIGPWYRETALDQAPAYGRPTLYLDMSSTSLIISQCGQMSTKGNYRWGGKQPIGTYQFYYDNYPKIPMIDAGGCNFAYMFPYVSDYISRRSAWRAVQAGSAGFGYGANGMWDMQWSPDSPHYGRLGQKTPWYVGIDAPSSWQMQWLQSFYTALPWPEMEPRTRGGPNSMIAWISGPAIDDISQPLVRADPSAENVVVYFPAEFPAASAVRLSNLAAYLYKAQWYDPRTGAFTTISDRVAPIDGQWGVPQKPGSDDWVLLLQKSPTRVPPVPSPDHSPVGNVDSVTSKNIRGWAYDPDASSTAIGIAVYIDGAYSTGTFIGYATANVSRPDVNRVHDIEGGHGFDFRIPERYATGSHSIYVYGLDTASGKYNALLTGSPKKY